MHLGAPPVAVAVAIVIIVSGGRIRVALQEEGVDVLERSSMRLLAKLGPRGLDLVAEHSVILVVVERGNLQQDRFDVGKVSQDIVE